MLTIKSLTASTTIASQTDLRALGTDKMLTRLRATAAAMRCRFFESGKILAILDESRKGGTLKSLVARKLGPDFDPESIGHGYKFAVIFSLVLKGTLAESDYDAGKTSWFISACASLNLMEKQEMTAEKKAPFIAEIAGLLTARPADTQEKLDAIKKSLTPAKEEKSEEGAESGEQADGETVAESPDPSLLATIATLGELAGTLLLGATEEQMNSAAPLLGKLPETVRMPLVGIFGERAKALGMTSGSPADLVKIGEPARRNPATVRPEMAAAA